jgi:AraC family transcriptional regulator
MAAADTFATFLELLEESLDEAGITSDALAARAHLSRFHFDRLVSAAAGEPPAALRRRILLERAAHRLSTTDDGVLAVALDAGYASNEAFTRAFTRAYGSSPSEWRREPGFFRLPGPSGVHFQPPGSLRLPAERKVNGMDLITRMVEHHVWLVGEMLARAERLPDETLDAPIRLSVEGIDDDPTLRSLLSRLVGQLEMWNAATDADGYDFGGEQGRTIAAMRAALAGAGPAFARRVRERADEGSLDETFVDAVCDPPEVFTYGGMVAHVLTFAAHRRVLVLGALADAGIEDLGAGDPMRFVERAA